MRYLLTTFLRNLAYRHPFILAALVYLLACGVFMLSVHLIIALPPIN